MRLTSSIKANVLTKAMEKVSVPSQDGSSFKDAYFAAQDEWLGPDGRALRKKRPEIIPSGRVHMAVGPVRERVDGVIEAFDRVVDRAVDALRKAPALRKSSDRKLSLIHI